MMKKLLLLCTLLFFSHSEASQLEKYKKIVANNQAKMQAFNQAHWKVNRVSKDGELILHESFDPSQSPHWQLIKINDQQPDSQQLKAYRKKQNRSESTASKSASLDTIIHLESLKIINEKRHHVTLSFAPHISDFSEQEQKKLTGSLLIDTQSGWLKTLKIHNTDKIKPSFFVSLQNFMINLEFAYQAQQVVLVKQQSYIFGKVGFFKTIKQEMEQTYYDYHFIGN